MILLDTHTLLWWLNRDTGRLSAPALAAINKELDGGRIYISSITTWEIARLVAHGRFTLTLSIAEWIALVEAIPAVDFLPIDNAVARESTELPEPFHKDPADRFIVATARLLSAPLVTIDTKIRDYPHVKTIW